MGDAYGAGLINHLSTDPNNLLEDQNGVINNSNVDKNRFHTEENGTTSTTTFLIFSFSCFDKILKYELFIIYVRDCPIPT